MGKRIPREKEEGEGCIHTKAKRPRGVSNRRSRELGCRAFPRDRKKVQKSGVCHVGNAKGRFSGGIGGGKNSQRSRSEKPNLFGGEKKNDLHSVASKFPGLSSKRADLNASAEGRRRKHLLSHAAPLLEGCAWGKKGGSLIWVDPPAQSIRSRGQRRDLDCRILIVRPSCKKR